MKRNQDIEDILKQWPFDPMSINVRLLQASQRDVLQMRVDMGILQMETDGRPDGLKPNNAKTYYDFLQKKARLDSETFSLDEDDCLEIDREFVQFYHRRVCWLQLKEFSRAVGDADHTLGLMDFCKKFSPDEQWTISHEQYRPFVLYHRTQAAALAWLGEEGEEAFDIEQLADFDDEATEATAEAAEMAIEEVNHGLAALHELFVEYEAEEQFDEDELVERLTEFREGLRKRYKIGRTLNEQLDDAIKAEDYEKAAEVRDLLARREQSQ